MRIPLAIWALLGLGFGYLFEQSNVPRGSLLYFLGVGSFARELPEIEPCEPARFHWEGFDDTATAHTVMTYGSRASVSISNKGQCHVVNIFMDEGE